MIYTYITDNDITDLQTIIDNTRLWYYDKPNSQWKLEFKNNKVDVMTTNQYIFYNEPAWLNRVKTWIFENIFDCDYKIIIDYCAIESTNPLKLFSATDYVIFSLSNLNIITNDDTINVSPGQIFINSDHIDYTIEPNSDELSYYLLISGEIKDI